MEQEANIPDFLNEKLDKQYGKDLAKEIIQGYTYKRPVTFRVNTLKTTKEQIKQTLEDSNITYANVIWYENAFIIENAQKEQIMELSLYKNGEIYLQSLSSMLPPIILNPKENTDILDMAAAPRRKNNPDCGIIKQYGTYYSM